MADTGSAATCTRQLKYQLLQATHHATVFSCLSTPHNTTPKQHLEQHFGVYTRLPGGSYAPGRGMSGTDVANLGAVSKENDKNPGKTHGDQNNDR